MALPDSKSSSGSPVLRIPPIVSLKGSGPPAGAPAFPLQVFVVDRSTGNDRDQLLIRRIATMTARMTIRTTRTMSK